MQQIVQYEKIMIPFGKGLNLLKLRRVIEQVLAEDFPEKIHSDLYIYYSEDCLVIEVKDAEKKG